MYQTCNLESRNRKDTEGVKKRRISGSFLLAMGYFLPYCWPQKELRALRAHHHWAALSALWKAHSNKCLENRETRKSYTTDGDMVIVIDGHRGSS